MILSLHEIEGLNDSLKSRNVVKYETFFKNPLVWLTALYMVSLSEVDTDACIVGIIGS